MNSFIVTVEMSDKSNLGGFILGLKIISNDFIQIQHNIWIVLSSKSIFQIKDTLSHIISEDDHLFVAVVTSTYDGDLTARQSDYLRHRIFDQRI